MATMTTTRERVEFKALKEDTICGAFQVTAAERADKVAIRTEGDELSITWGEYAERVEKIAAGLAKLGLKRGDTVGVMLSNRPEFHLVDTAAMHLGATPYSVYNTYSPSRSSTSSRTRRTTIVITEQALPRHDPEGQGGVRERQPRDRRSTAAEGAMTLEELESSRRRRTSTSRPPGRPSSPTTCSR